MTDKWLKDMMKRVTAMEVQALTDDGVSASGVHYYPYQQENFPYFVNRLTDVRFIPENSGEDEYIYELEVTGWLVIGHLTAGYKYENNEKIYDYLVPLLNYFNMHRDLTSDAYTEPPDYLDPLDMTFDLAGGVSVFTNAGISAQQIGVQFTLTTQYRISRPNLL